MSLSSSVEPGQDERILAAICHAGMLIGMFGLAAAAIIWATQKDKSPYVAFQALQAIVFQVIQMVVSFLWAGCYFLAMFGSFALLSPQSNPDGFPTFMLVPFAAIALMAVVSLAFLIYAGVGAVMTLLGRDFRYVLVANWIEQYMQPAPLGR